MSGGGKPVLFKATGVMLRLKRLLHAENSTGLAETSCTGHWEQKHYESLTVRSVFVMRRVHTEKGASFTESPYMQNLFSPGSPLMRKRRDWV